MNAERKSSTGAVGAPFGPGGHFREEVNFVAAHEHIPGQEVSRRGQTAQADGRSTSEQNTFQRRRNICVLSECLAGLA